MWTGLPLVYAYHLHDNVVFLSNTYMPTLHVVLDQYATTFFMTLHLVLLWKQHFPHSLHAVPHVATWSMFMMHNAPGYIVLMHFLHMASTPQFSLPWIDVIRDYIVEAVNVDMVAKIMSAGMSKCYIRQTWTTISMLIGAMQPLSSHTW